MNMAQRICIFVGLALILVAVLFPSYQKRGVLMSDMPWVKLGYYCIFRPPQDSVIEAPPSSHKFTRIEESRIDFSRLGLTWAVIGVATALAVVACSGLSRRRKGDAG